VLGPWFLSPTLAVGANSALGYVGRRWRRERTHQRPQFARAYGDRMQVDSLPLVGPPTPLLPMSRLGSALGIGTDRLWVKRDDLTLVGGGGNKARKLALLCADALDVGATVLVTGGAVQSNHVRVTGAAAAMAGLRAVGVVGGRRGAPEGNVVLDALFGIELIDAADRYGAVDLAAAIEAECERLRSAGERPYHIPLGGSSPLGASGYVAAAEEIRAALGDCTVYVADGTGGTHAGLVAGFGDHRRVRGVDVGAVPDVAGVVAALAGDVASVVDRPVPIGVPWVDGGQVGAGYGRSTRAAEEAMTLAARTEGLVLDPVYTSKAFAAMVHDVRDQALPDGPVVFLHTGGLPGLFVERHMRTMAGG